MAGYPKKIAKLSMTVQEFSEKLKEMDPEAQIVSLSPYYELKEQLVPLKNISLCKCVVSKNNYFEKSENCPAQQTIYERNEKEGFACVNLSFYGPQRIRSSVKNLIELLYQVEEDAIVVTNSSKPSLLFKMTGIKRIKTRKLNPAWKTSTDIFDQRLVESLIFKEDYEGDINGVVLEF